MKKSSFLFERKELKYLITARQKERFMKSIEGQITADEYPQYTLRNVYLDTPDFRLIRNSMEKTVYKEKMRIRSYGKADSEHEVFIELKKKYKGIVYKRRVRMSLKDAADFLGGRSVRDGQIEREIDYFLNFYKGISPTMFISYEREAYHGAEDSELRITFDGNILWRDEDLSLSSEPYGVAILDPSQSLMEIKCAGAMPLWLTKALTENRMYKSSFSKYGEAYMQMTSRDYRKAAG